MKPLRAAEVRRVVGVAGQALTAVLDTRHRIIDSSMLNSAGSVSAEWYIETLWHYLAKRSLVQGVSSIDSRVQATGAADGSATALRPSST